MFRHQGAILRRFIKKKYNKYNMYLGASRTCPLYIFDSVNMRRIVTDGLDKEIVVTIQRVLKSSRNVPASWQIYKKSRSSQRLLGKPWELIASV